MVREGLIECWLPSAREEALLTPAPDRVRIGGPVRPFADGYLAPLVELGMRFAPRGLS